MTDLQGMSQSELDERFALVNRAHSDVIRRLVEAGFGHETGQQTRARAARTGDPLALEYGQATDAFFAVIDENDRRRAEKVA